MNILMRYLCEHKDLISAKRSKILCNSILNCNSHLLELFDNTYTRYYSY